jgi:hypothetical protein
VIQVKHLCGATKWQFSRILTLKTSAIGSVGGMASDTMPSSSARDLAGAKSVLITCFVTLDALEMTDGLAIVILAASN